MIALNKNSYYSWDEYPVSFCVFSGMVLEWPDFGRGAPESQRVLFRVEGMHHSLYYNASDSQIVRGFESTLYSKGF